MPDARRRRVAQSSYGASNNRTTLGYWVPLALTVTAATVGLAAWIWSERKEHEEEDSSADEQHRPGGRPPAGYANMSGAIPPGPGQGPGSAGFQGPQGPEGPPPEGYQGPMNYPPQPEWGNNRSVRAQSTGVEQTRTTATTTATEETGLISRMSNALGMGRSSSPSKAIDWASRNIAAAAATVGGALGYSEETKHQYEDHSRWSEEVAHRDSTQKENDPASRGLKRQGTAQEFYSGSIDLPKSASIGAQRRKTVAIVVSSVQDNNDDEDVGGHASILAALPQVVDHNNTRIFVLIYAPSLTVHPLSPAATNNQPGSRAESTNGRRLSQSRNSSFSHINTDEARTPGEFPGEKSGDGGILVNLDPNPIDEHTSTLYKTLHNQAMVLVDRDTMIIPFTSAQGHKHILKSLQPEMVYMQESLCGREGEVVSELSGFVRTTIVVIGDEGGMGGLVDTDTEDESARKSGGQGEKWWKREERTGVGRGVGVVEALRIREDWKRRVGGEE